MNLTGNTIFITGGGSGIGRALAEVLHKRGNKVIISGRRKSHLDSVRKANPGIETIELDIADPDSIKAVAKKVIAEHPDLNVLINNAGIMEPDQAAEVIDDELLVSTVTTNLLGPIRLTSALVDQLKSRRGVIVYNTSVLAFVPLAVTAIYSATKAALHSYVLSQRFLLRGSGVRVLEVAPPWVRTELMNSQEAEQAMPLDRFIAETLEVLGTDADEILIEAAKPLRANPGPEEHALVNGFNQEMLKLPESRPNRWDASVVITDQLDAMADAAFRTGTYHKIDTGSFHRPSSRRFTQRRRVETECRVTFRGDSAECEYA